MRKDPDFAWLDSTGFFTIDLGLDRVERLLERLGRPQDSLRFAHVAGSNGKGSVCALTEAALRKCGFSTGFYCSPHLIRLNERFRINGKVVDDKRLRAAAETVRTEVEAMRKSGENPTYFEITTAIALVLFREEKLEFVAWETGMGGRLDATNVVTPLVSVITGISLEHTAWLGGTLGKIAGEKAGIIKPGVPVVRGPMPEEAAEVIAATARERHSPLVPVEPFNEIYTLEKPVFQNLTRKGHSFRIALPGAYQRNNACIAFETVALLAEKLGFDFSLALSGFEDARWPARFQFVPEKNLMIDGAHNPEGAAALADALREFHPGEKFHFLSGCFADKNAEAVLDALAPLAKDFVFLEFNGDGREVRSPGELGVLLRKKFPAVPWKRGTLEESLNHLQSGCGGEPTVLCGSLHMCGEALEQLGLPG